MRLFIVTCCLIVCCCARTAFGVDVDAHPPLQKLVDAMVADDGYPRAELIAVLSGAQLDDSVLRLMNRQSEKLPWHRYRDLLINDARIIDGGVYWRNNVELLARAEREFGVPASIIVAVIGVETSFGVRQGERRVLDTLVTLSATYPRRSAYFTRELRVFLNLMRAEDIAANSVYGSFAGAVGIAQFMPSSYRQYAVDFDADGVRDLRNNDADAIGSVGNYLNVHGWRAGGAIVHPLDDAIIARLDAVERARLTELVSRDGKPNLTVAELATVGIDVGVDIDGAVYVNRPIYINVDGEINESANSNSGTVVDGNADNKVDNNANAAGELKIALLELKRENDFRYVLGFDNFYVITRYNHSIHYAMAVTTLAQLIEKQFLATK